MTMTRTIDVLRMARDLVAAGWCQDTEARDVHGVAVHPTDPTACRFCASSAIKLAIARIGDLDPQDVFYICITVFREANSIPAFVHLWNDDRNTTQTDVIRAFDNAIASNPV